MFCIYIFKEYALVAESGLSYEGIIKTIEVPESANKIMPYIEVEGKPTFIQSSLINK